MQLWEDYMNGSSVMEIDDGSGGDDDNDDRYFFVYPG